MSSDLTPFLQHANAQVKAELIANHLTDAGDQAFLLWKAYLKRIRPVPETVAKALNAQLMLAAEAAGITFDTEAEAIFAADLAGDALWDHLYPDVQRMWLLKAT